MKLHWRPRSQPLAIEGACAQGQAAGELAVRLLARPSCRELSGVQARDCLIILGPAEQLPWCEGVIYLGRASTLHPLYLPTHLAPTLPVAWLADALQERCPPPWALLPDNRAVGLGPASALDSEVLERFRHDHAHPSA